MFLYPDGSKYEGDWVEDQRCGQGKYFYINADVYEGEWFNNVRHGHGSYTYAETGTKFVGQWKEGKREGHGELLHGNHKFVGLFKEDRVSVKFRVNFNRLKIVY